MNKRKVGADKESIAAAYLQENGCQIIKQNFRCRQGEIDLIARHKEYLVFAEVKYRKDSAMGSPEEAVGLRKQKTICRVADFYRACFGIGDHTPVRYDVIAICGEEITWIQNAFMHHYS